MRRHHQSPYIPRPHPRGIPRRDKIDKLDVPSRRVFDKFVGVNGPIGDVVGEEVLEVVEDAGCVVGA